MATTQETNTREVTLTITIRALVIDVNTAREIADRVRDVVDDYEKVEINVIENKPRDSMRI